LKSSIDGRSGSASVRVTSLLLSSVIALPWLRSVLPIIPSWSHYVVVLLFLCFSIYQFSRRVVDIALIGWLTPFLLLFGWLAFSVFWSRSMYVYQEDLLLILGLSGLLIGSVLSNNENMLDSFLVCVSGWALLAGIVTIVDYALVGDLSGYTVGVHEYYLTASMLIGIGVVGSALRFLTINGSSARWGITALILMGALSLSLARGALISAVVVTLFLGAYNAFRKSKSRENVSGTWTKMGLVLGALTIMIYLALQIERTRTKLLRLFFGDELAEGGRGLLWENSWYYIKEAPIFGHGLGSSGMLSSGDPSYYPHNALFQVWLDGGIIAALLLTTALALPLLQLLNPKRRAVQDNDQWVPFMGIYLFLVLEYSKSYNFYTARPLIVFSACLWGALSITRKKCGPVWN
jgi:O-antigen ligase